MATGSEQHHPLSIGCKAVPAASHGVLAEQFSPLLCTPYAHNLRWLESTRQLQVHQSRETGHAKISDGANLW